MDLIPCPPYKVSLSNPDRTILVIVSWNNFNVNAFCICTVGGNFSIYILREDYHQRYVKRLNF